MRSGVDCLHCLPPELESCQTQNLALRKLQLQPHLQHYCQLPAPNHIRAEFRRNMHIDFTLESLLTIYGVLLGEAHFSDRRNPRYAVALH